MVRNLKLDLSLGQFNVEKGKHILLMLPLLPVAVIEGCPKHIFGTSLLYYYSLHVIDDI